MVTGSFSLVGIEDGIGYEEIYRLTSSSTTPSTPSSSNTNGAVPSGWYSTPQSVTRTYPYQWVSKRSKVDGNWGVWSTPVEYNRFVEDAKTYEYCYKATQYNSTPSTPTSSNVDGSVPSGWYPTPPSISATNAYIWECQRVKTNGTWSSWSAPKLKNRWAYDGANGDKGAKMRMRTWASGVRYLQGAEGEEFYDIVVYETKLYLCTKTHTSSSSNNPVTSIESYLGYWESAQQWTFIATQLLLAGKIVSDKITADLIDATNLVATDVDISGKITATKGKVGGWTINGNNLECIGSDAQIYIGATKAGYMTINDSDTIMCRIRAGGEGTGLSISTYGENDSTTGLHVLCNAGGYGKAIESYGNVLLRARPSEKILINGLAVNVVNVNSSSYTVLTNDDYINIKTGTTLTMPSRLVNKGKIYYIRLTSTTAPTPTVKITSNLLSDFRAANGAIVDYIQFNDLKPRILISDGSYWNEFISA